jgi:hypothetical protein
VDEEVDGRMGGVDVERLGEGVERQGACSLEGPPRQHLRSASRGLDGQLGEQARLADPGLTRQ